MSLVLLVMISPLAWLCAFLLGSYFIRSIVSSNVNVMDHPQWSLLDNDKCGISNTDRIIGGKNANLGAYPWIARVGYTIHIRNQNKKDYRCGGALINKYYVLTAAHCLTNLPQGITIDSIRLGEHNTETNPDCEGDYCADPVQDFQIAFFKYHEDYNNPQFRNDIAIIRLDRPAVFNDFVMPICMPYGPMLDKDYIGEKAEVAGWGIYEMEQLRTSTILRTVALPIRETEVCIKIFRGMISISHYQICAGGVVGEDSCNGDSGGPLMKVDEDIDGLPRYHLIGLVSFGVNRCGSTTTPGIYTKISSYMTWILDNISP